MNFICLTFFLFFQITRTIQFDEHLTVQNAFTHVKNGSSSRILCYPTHNNPTDFYLIRTESGQGTEMPKYSAVRRLGAPTHTLAIIMEHQDGNARFGAYTCKENTSDTEITTFKLPDPDYAEVIALQSYFSKNIDEDVTFRVNTSALKLPLVWYHNGNEIARWADQTTVVISSIKTSDSGIYECFYDGHRHLGLHALIQLIVRGCAANKWGKDCKLDCLDCYNGGICHETFGICICPVGFDGDNCEIACGKNSFGKDCKKKCDYESTDDEIESCAGYLFCSPHPVGCGCAAGFNGKLCIEDCTEGSYGPDCAQTCHCNDGSACDTITGSCSTGCEDGWSGNSCEIGSESTTGTYGFPVCEDKCNCLNDTLFDSISGECLLGCKVGWTGVNCSVCSSGLFGPDCNTVCHCLNGNDSCDPVNGHCNGGCSAGFTGVDCQTICSKDEYGPDCSLQCSCLNGGSCDPQNGVCSCFDPWYGALCNETSPMVILIEPLEVNTGAVVNLTCIIQSTNPLTNYSILSEDLSDLHTDIKEINETHYKVIAKTNITESINVNCSGTNIHGSDMQQITLINIDPPYLKSLPQVTNVTDTTITIHWNEWEFGKDGGGKLNDEIEYKVVLKTTANEAKSEWISKILTKEMDQLNPDEEYEVYIVCRRPGIGGEGPETGFVTARTNCQIPVVNSILPTNLTVNDYGSTYIKLSWINLPFTRGYCKNMTYKISWNANDIQTYGKIEVLDTEDEFNITNLIPGINYEIEITLHKDDVAIGTVATVEIETLPLIIPTIDIITSLIITTTIPTPIATTESTCDDGKFGPSCSEDCVCPEDSTCNSIDGSCNCIYPLAGIFCNETAPNIITLHPLEINSGAESVNLTCIINSTNRLEDVTIWSIDFLDSESSIQELNDTNLFEATINTNISQNITVNCTGTNAHGSANQQFNLTIIDPPYLVQAPDVFNVTENSMEIEWSKWQYDKDGGGKLNDDIEYRVVVRYKENNWHYYDWHKTRGSKIGGLKAENEYEVVIQCRRPGIGGEGKFSPSTIITTSCLIPTINTTWPKDLKCSDYGNNFIFIKWKNLHHKKIICKDSVYEVMWSVGNTTSSIIFDTSQDEYNFTNLEPNSNYQFVIKLLAGGHVVGKPATLFVNTTNLINIIGPVLNLKTTAVTSKDVILAWEKPSELDEIDFYLVKIEFIETIGCINISKETVQLKVTELQENITNLHPNSIYLISVEASVSQQLGTIEFVNVTTHEDVPVGSPANLTQTTVSGTELKITWNSIPCELINSASWTYNYIIADQDQKVILHNKTTDNFVILSMNTIEQNYTFNISIETSNGMGPVSILLINKQLEESEQSIGPVNNLRVTTLSSREIIVSWEQPLTSIEIDSYHLRIELLGIIGCTNISKQIFETDVQDLMTNITDLHPNSIYWISIQASASKQLGPVSFLNVTTYADVPEDLPLKLTQKILSDTEVQFEWDSVPCESINSLNWTYEYTVATEDKQIVLTNTTINNHVILPMDIIEHNYTFIVRITTPYAWGLPTSLLINKPIKQTEKPQVYLPSPQNIKLRKATSTTLEIEWKKPFTNETITGYRIHFNRISTNYHILTGTATKTIAYPVDYSIVLQSLTPASVYKIEITAIYNDFQSEPATQYYNTLYVDYEEGIPTVLDTVLAPPKLSSNESGLLILTIYSATNADKVKAYQVIVVDEENNEIIDEKNLQDYYTASEQKKHYYIIAEVTARDVSENGYDLTLGDNKTYNGYINIPLDTQKEYRLYVRAIGLNKEVSDMIECIAEEPVDAQSRIKDSNKSTCEIVNISCAWFIAIVAGIIAICIILLLVSLTIFRKRRKEGILEIQQSNECLDGRELRETIKRSSKSRTYSSTSHSSQKT